MFFLKDYLYINYFFILDYYGRILLIIIPFFLLIFYTFYGSLSNFDFYVNLTIFLTCVFLFFLFSCCNIFCFILLLEATVYLIIYSIFSLSKDTDKISSATFMFFLNLLGSIPFIVSCSYAYIFYPLNFLEFSPRFFNDMFIYLGVLVVLLTKLPRFLVHFWLTKAHVSASGACSMLLARLILKIGSIGLYKVSFSSSLLSDKFLSFITVFSCVSCFFICIFMLRFLDVKNIIACSSILHISFTFYLLLFGSNIGVYGRFLIGFGHGLVSCSLFYFISLFYEVSHNRRVDYLKRWSSIGGFFSFITFSFLLINLGVPPFLNFVRELYSCSIFYYFSSSLFISLFFILLLSVFFTIIIIIKINFGTKESASFNYFRGKLIWVRIYVLLRLVFCPLLF